MSTPPQYEFNQGQDALIADLASKMRGVGFIWRLVGLLGVALAVLIGVVSYRRYQWAFPLDAWAVISGQAFLGLFNLLIGGWTLSAAASFRRIVDTQGSDLSHLMNALRALHQMFALIYSLMVFAILLFLVSLGLGLYHLLQAPAG